MQRTSSKRNMRNADYKTERERERERKREREGKRKIQRERERERVKYALKKRLIYINFIDVKITDGYRKFKSYPGYDKSFDIAIGKHIQNLNLVILNFAC